MCPNSSASTEGRWLLYRLLAEPTRVRLIALTAEAELSIGELADLLDELQPNVSRHVTALRQGNVLLERRQGTRNYIRLSPSALKDVVVMDALHEGRQLCLKEGRIERIALVLGARETSVKQSTDLKAQDDILPSRALPAYVLGLSKVFSGRKLVVDVSTGDGARLDALAPFFRRVVAIEQRTDKLDRAKRRIGLRGYWNVELLHGSLEDREVQRAVGNGACAVFAKQVLRNVEASPLSTLASLVTLLRPGGTLVLFELVVQENDAFTEQASEAIFGFSIEELRQLALSCGLLSVEVSHVPPGFVQDQSVWLLLAARRPGTYEVDPNE